MGRIPGKHGGECGTTKVPWQTQAFVDVADIHVAGPTMSLHTILFPPHTPTMSRIQLLSLRRHAR